MNDLLFIRHAETNMAGTFCGQSDPPISQRGQNQIKELMSALVRDSFDLIYTSDLCRAIGTATPIAETLGLSLLSRTDLREMHFGQWEGKRWSEIESENRAFAALWMQNFPDLPAPGGEPFSEFRARVLREISYLRSAATGKRAIVVTHGGVMRVVLQTMLGYSEQAAWELTRDYCSSFEFLRDADIPQETI
jgi:alpha-ribazole phosphatase/probable phosphoglycerate mutase